MEPKYTIAIAETLTGDFDSDAFGGTVSLLVETSKDEIVGLAMRSVTARSLAMFLTDLVDRQEAAVQAAQELRKISAANDTKG
jgi:hypothetical protein